MCPLHTGRSEQGLQGTLSQENLVEISRECGVESSPVSATGKMFPFLNESMSGLELSFNFQHN